MCAKAAFILQGKSSPHYRPNKVIETDKVIIVNARYTFLTGKKLDQKLYRHHSGYPGGLKEITARNYLEKNPCEMVWRSVKGMLPKNRMRPDFLGKLKIFEEGGHDLQRLGIPQFGQMKPIDYNELAGIPEDPEKRKKLKIVYSNVQDIDKYCNYYLFIILVSEYKDIPKELNPDLYKTPTLRAQNQTRVNTSALANIERFKRSFRRKHLRRIKNMNYRLI
jgi:large subunit ribosomal protein L13